MKATTLILIVLVVAIVYILINKGRTGGYNEISVIESPLAMAGVRTQ